MSQLRFKGWNTTNIYDKAFKEPEGRGVYIIVEHFEFGQTRLLYIGSSNTLEKRIRDHEILRIASFFCWKLKVYWKGFNDHLTKESELIKEYNPSLNRKV